MRRLHPLICLPLLSAGCDSGATAPCLPVQTLPVLEITAAGDPATGAAASALSLTDITLDGVPVDSTVLRTNLLDNVERDGERLLCTLPCMFGVDPGTYAFDIRASGFYAAHAQVEARYTDVPPGCPVSQGRPTRVSFDLVEADSARVHFSFAQRAATGLPSDIASVTFDDGSGPRSIDVEWPWRSYVTRNTGTLQVRFVVGAPDTIAVGEIALDLRKDWEWGVGAYLYDRSPTEESFCIEAKSFPLLRPVTGADSLWIGWGGLPLSENVAC